jgi:hypothetical protein
MKNLTAARRKIEATKNRLIAKAAKSGLYENFGQDEVRKFIDTLGGDAYGTDEERAIDRAIQAFSSWAMNYTPFG